MLNCKTHLYTFIYFFQIIFFRFTIKVGLASAAVYYVKEQGVWKNSNESIKTYEKLKETVKPYAQDLKAQIPIEVRIM